MAKVVITGANRGIGLALTRLYLARGDSVTALCRAASAALRDSGATLEEGVDVAKDDLGGLAERFAGRAVDLLINNAGVLDRDGLEPLDVDAMRRQLEVNTLGPLKVTAALLPCLGRGARVGLVTSRMGSISDNTSGGYYGYRMSKAALNAAGASLALDLKPRGVAVALLHPGFVRTEMTGGQGSWIPPTPPPASPPASTRWT